MGSSTRWSAWILLAVCWPEPRQRALARDARKRPPTDWRLRRARLTREDRPHDGGGNRGRRHLQRLKRAPLRDDFEGVPYIIPIVLSCSPMTVRMQE